MPKSYCPKADIMVVSKDAKKLRNSLSGFLPNIGLSMIDYGRSAEVDRFYLSCQNHRDYYKDFTGRMPRVEEFIISPKQFASSPEPTNVYVQQPLYYLAERRPLVYPVTIERKGRPPNDKLSIDLSGQYNAVSCVKYKR